MPSNIKISTTLAILAFANVQARPAGSNIMKRTSDDVTMSYDYEQSGNSGSKKSNNQKSRYSSGFKSASARNNSGSKYLYPELETELTVLDEIVTESELAIQALPNVPYDSASESIVKRTYSYIQPQLGSKTSEAKKSGSKNYASKKSGSKKSAPKSESKKSGPKSGSKNSSSKKSAKSYSKKSVSKKAGTKSGPKYYPEPTDISVVPPVYNPSIPKTDVEPLIASTTTATSTLSDGYHVVPTTEVEAVYLNPESSIEESATAIVNDYAVLNSANSLVPKSVVGLLAVLFF